VLSPAQTAPVEKQNASINKLLYVYSTFLKQKLLSIKLFYFLAINCILAIVNSTQLEMSNMINQ